MENVIVNKKDYKLKFWKRYRWQIGSAIVLLILLSLSIIAFAVNRPVYTAAPEVEDILAAQENLNFGILIPTYMPKGFDRETVEIKVIDGGPSGEKSANLTYRNLGKKSAIFFKQWVPGFPEKEILNNSVPIETNWGKGWLLTQTDGKGMGTIWVDIGQLRVSVSSANLKLVPPAQLLQMANTLGLASEDQVYTFKTDPIVVKGIAPPPPYKVALNNEGIQEFNLTITPGGYSPVRFQVKRGIPVKINFRAVGEVGCGNTGALTLGDGTKIGISVTKEEPLDIVEFTPQVVGDFPFYCTTNCYRGIMTVVE
jgi:hypothetical protein